jgi:hypothetical protein
MTLVHPHLQALGKSPLPPFVKGESATLGDFGSQGLCLDLPAPFVKGGARRLGIRDRKGCVPIFLLPSAKGGSVKQGEIGNRGSWVRILCGVI